MRSSGAEVYRRTGESPGDQLVQEYLPLVKQIALHLAARLPPHIEVDDLMQVGLIGLIKARETHDASQGASFATYAGIRIRGAMLDELRRHDWVPRTVQSNLKRVADVMAVLEGRLGRAPGDSEIAEALDLSIDEYHHLSAEISYARTFHIEDLEGDIGDGDDNNPDRLVDDAEFKAALKQAILGLPEKEKLMMSLYYGEGMNLKEIGLILEVSESRVSQLHGQACARLSAALGDWRGAPGGTAA